MEDNTFDELFDKIVILLRKQNLIGTCLLGSILLHEALKKRNISSKLQEGFLIVNDIYYSYHIWLVINGKNYDVGLKVTHISLPNEITYRLSIDEPKEMERIDLDNKQEIYEYTRMKKVYSGYLKNPNIYWKSLDKKYLRNWENLNL